MHKACCKPKIGRVIVQNQGCIMSLYPIYNFSAGPAVLPEAVLRTAQQEMSDYNGTGFPVMAMSHRSEMFLSILHHAEQDLRQLLKIPDNYKILFLQGGATTQFNMAAMNLAHGFRTADAVVTGNWSRIAYEQMSRLTDTEIRLAAHGGEQFDYLDLPPVETWDVAPDSAFVHFAVNETVNGLQYREVPRLSDGMPPLVCDMSSEILSREFDVADYGLIYAGAQKNIGPAGVTVVIVREDLLERCPNDIPDVFNYRSHLNRDGMYNTPSTYAIYMSGLVFRWLQAQGGVKKIEAVNRLKAQTLYETIDGSGGFYINDIHPDARSKMNVVFKTASEDLDRRFVLEAELQGLCLLKGYKSVGGMRASIYNAMPLEGVRALADFMRDFQRRYG
ncbi:MFS transporter [Neisseria gonorrhoeae SK33414]|nr:MFS transporter [Neisseria gonorrhoeae SK33414]KLS32628.1 MFS transporter [Neisseria gonorrhoeae ALB_2011_03_03]KLS38362.1 MFS transporter [Neisseria gonorrhoeae ATL_2011_01_05]KLS79231.1 MFS transporter [Neisseria gonorrhoeae MU_NG1]KLS90540.1 MFS transporter [Neisseria gonorrhoeae MU_NG6]KMY25559.1 phosphoserine aminotransferase [Neisseria gonorrhoeae FA6140]